MKYTTKIIFGKEQVNRHLAGIELSKDEKEINLKEFSFESKLELDAFLKGLYEGVGWLELHQIDN